ncbi:MAG: hypothetical protein JWM93_1309, partial [Frankiales bacterium]|nr:hypothetical protein [Frankiales bacterium]
MPATDDEERDMTDRATRTNRPGEDDYLAAY